MADAWPPTLEDLKLDLGKKDDTKDGELQQVLSAAVAFVERVRAGDYEFGGGLSSSKPAPDPAADADLFLGTVRLAGRWHTRRRSPDMLVQSGELGASRVSSTDPDIDRMLRIGRYARPVVA